jgi:hypothetical protein
LGFPLTPAAFIVSNLVVTPESVEAGKDANVIVTVTNTGELNGKYTAALHVGGSIEATRDVTLNGNETQQVSFTVKRDAGTYYVSIENLYGSIIYLKPAEFAASELVLSSNSVEAGEDITVSFKLVNKGEVSGKYTATLQIDGDTGATEDVNLAGGESQPVTFIINRSEPGGYIVAVGSLSASFIYLKPAAFTISELGINPTSIQKNKLIIINFLVTNTGEISGVYTPTLKVNDTVAGTKNITLAGGENQLISFELIPEKAGTYIVDADGLHGSFVVKQFNLLLLLVGVGGVLAVVTLLIIIFCVRWRNG